MERPGRPGRRGPYGPPRRDLEPPGPPPIPPPRSALTPRLILAVFGFVVCGGGAWLFANTDIPAVFTAVLVVLAAFALADILVIVRRKRRGEPG